MAALLTCFRLVQVEQLQTELVAVQAQSKETPETQSTEAEQALQDANNQIEILRAELAAMKKELEAVTSNSATACEHTGQQNLMGLADSAHATVVTIANSLGQPEPSTFRRISSAGTKATVSDVISTMNAACSVAMSAQHAWDAERRALEDKVVQSAATAAMNAMRDASVETNVMKEELLKLQGQIELLEQRETDLAAAQDRSKVQIPRMCCMFAQAMC